EFDHRTAGPETTAAASPVSATRTHTTSTTSAATFPAFETSTRTFDTDSTPSTSGFTRALDSTVAPALYTPISSRLSQHLHRLPSPPSQSPSNASNNSRNDC